MMTAQTEPQPVSRHEMIWNEAGMFARDLIAPQWIDKNWQDLPEKVREQFVALISEDIPREAFL